MTGCVPCNSVSISAVDATSCTPCEAGKVANSLKTHCGTLDIKSILKLLEDVRQLKFLLATENSVHQSIF